MTRLTFDRGIDSYPLWSPDGRRIVFFSTRAGVGDLYAQSADGTGPVEQLTMHANAGAPASFSPDGRMLVFHDGTTATSADLALLRLGPMPQAEPLLKTPFIEGAADISPDGHWLAYHSNESGLSQVYVRPFPGVDGGRWQISTAGGSRPAWSKDGKELFFLDATTAMNGGARADDAHLQCGNAGQAL